MGGKHNLANRTKNNARPSSSGRSAAMLNSSLPQFGGFSNVKEPSGLSPFAFGPLEEYDPSVEECFQLVIKKISKKDSTTKLKGLQEFVELVKNSEPEAVKAILPIWPRIYSSLATDPDNRVREATHNVHHEIVIKVKRNIAPYLKLIMAPWFVSQYDNYPPAATAAVQAFKETFSDVKFQEAIIFCQDEILCYIYETLSAELDQFIAGNTILTQDPEAKYERSLISCLQGYSLYLQKVPIENIKTSAELNLKIVSSKSFWIMATSKIPLVKSAWFQVFSVILQKAVFLVEGKESQVLNIILKYLDDDEPIVLPHVWECLLLATSVIDDWWKYINIEKMLIPRLLRMLKQAGQGNAVIIYPNLLPLLSTLPTRNKEIEVQFYHTFFDAMCSGLKLKSVANSKSESTAIAAAFIECLQFLIIKNISDIDVCKDLIKRHLISTIVWCIVTDDNSCHKRVFHQTTLFVQNLSRSSKSNLNDTLIHFFFDSIRSEFHLLFEPELSNVYDITVIADRQIEFVRSLKQINRLRRESHVQFVGEEDKTHHQKKTIELIPPRESYFKLIDQLSVHLFQDYAKSVSANSSMDLVDKMSSLVMDCEKKTFFASILADMRATDGDNVNYTLMDIYELLFKPWLMVKKFYCKSVIDLVFLFLSIVDDQKQKKILQDLTNIDQPDCLMWSVSTALSYPHVDNAVVRKWLKENKVGSFFISIAKMQINNECSPDLQVILKLALTEDRNGDLIVTKDVLMKLTEMISSTLLEDNSKDINLNACVTLASNLCNIIYTETLQLTYGDKLLLTLIQSSCKFGNKKENLTSETILEIKSSWQDALIILLNNLDGKESNILAEKIAVIIENQFFLTSVTSQEQVEHLANVIVICINAFYKSTSPFSSSLVDLIFRRSWMTRNQIIVEICKASEYINGHLSNPNSEILLNGSINEKEILQYFIWEFIQLSALCSNLSTSEEFDGQCLDYRIFDDSTQMEVLNVDSPSENTLLESLYTYTVGESFLMHFKNVKYYKEILYYNSLLEKKLKTVLANLNETMLTNFKTNLRSKRLSYGWFWSKAEFILHSDFLKIDNYSNVYDELTESLLKNNLTGIMHISQISKNNEAEDITKMVKQMETLREANVSDISYSDAYNMSWEKTEKVIYAVRLSSNIIQYCPLDQTHWDFIVISLASWVSNCLKAKSLVDKFQYQAMLISVSKLYISICQRVEKWKEENVNTSFVNEWQDVLLESIHADLAQIWLYLAERLSTESENTIIFKLPLVQSFGPVTEHIRYEFIFKLNDNLPKWTKFLTLSCSLLTNSQVALQLLGYRMLKMLIPGLVKIDTEAVNTSTPHKKGLIFEQFKEKLTELENVVNSMLMDFRVGENTCRVEPSYDSFTYTFAYLLLWDVMLCLCEEASADLRYQYTYWLKSGDFLRCFLSNLFMLTSTEIFQSGEGKSKPSNEYFFKYPLDSTCYDKFCNSDTIEHLVCYLYKTSLVQLPALVRQWWTDLDIKGSQLVDKVTTLYVSPHLCMGELNDVIEYQNVFKNMKVKVMPGIREILATYTVDETQMELTITLPVNYPLGSPTVNCNKQISGANQKQWLLQFTKCVLHQNGRIWDGLALWNNNLDKKFDGVEECFICYAVLHFGTCQLPRLSCQTCKKKFHSACLYKWFSTSNKSSCPICRNLF